MPATDDPNWSMLEQSLRPLGETQLQIQVATAIGYDTQALGLMAVAAAVGGVLLALESTLEHFWWIASLVASTVSIVACLASLSFASTDAVGQNLRLALADSHAADEIQSGIVESISEAVVKNEPALTRRRTATKIALALLLASLVLAVLAKVVR
jgi:hypothetical protein